VGWEPLRYPYYGAYYAPYSGACYTPYYESDDYYYAPTYGDGGYGRYGGYYRSHGFYGPGYPNYRR
jgi:hypothetical protein